MILRLCAIELLKIRRSLVLLMTLACPLAVVAMVFGMNLRNAAPGEATPEQWNLMWAGVSAMWSWFMLPLYVALATSLINGNEHRNQAWRLMLSLPIRRWELYAAKAAVACLLMVSAHLVLLIAVVGLLFALGAFGYPLAGAFDVNPRAMLWAAPVAALPMLAVQHALSWRLRSIVPPLAVAVVATFVSIQLGRSDLWPLLPWTYPLISTNAGDATLRLQALALAVSLAVVLFPLGAWWAGRRDVV